MGVVHAVGGRTVFAVGFRGNGGDHEDEAGERELEDRDPDAIEPLQAAAGLGLALFVAKLQIVEVLIPVPFFRRDNVDEEQEEAAQSDAFVDVAHGVEVDGGWVVEN